METRWPGSLVLCLLLLLVGGADSSPARTERTAAILSPTGKHTVTVEWTPPEQVGDSVEYSGQMRVRVADTGGTLSLQRDLQAPQVRSIQVPLWLDDRWSAFSYNIQKNSNGIVYVDMQDGRVLQLEMVAPARRMGATGQIQSDLTSLNIVEFLANRTESYSNITRGRQSLFPLVLPEVPAWKGGPYSRGFLNELQASLKAYRQWLDEKEITALIAESGTESFAPDERHFAVLVCLSDAQSTAPVPGLVIAPVTRASAGDVLRTTRLVRLDSPLDLPCMAALRPGESETAYPVDYVRYTTRWQDARTVAVEREVVDDEREELQREPVYLATVDGETTRLPAADWTPPVQEDHTEEAAAEMAEEAVTPGPTPEPSSPGPGRAPEQVSRQAADENKDTAPPRMPVRTSAPVRPSPPSPGRPAERRVPGVSVPRAGNNVAPRPAQPTPYQAEPIPSLWQRLGRSRSGDSNESPRQPESAE